jgi:cobalt/nickel transport system ATP-binding protein
MTPLLELEELRYCYPGQSSPALDGASLSLPAGQKVVMMGRNGSGKSTLFLHCNGILRPDRGQIYLAGTPVRYDRGSLMELRRQVGIVFQNPEDQLFSASVAQDISFGPLNMGLSEQEARDRVADAAAICGVSDLLDRPTHSLSGGEKARVALAGVLAMDPRLLLIDEVTSTLDPWIRRQLLIILGRLVATGKTVVMATHDVEIARRWADLLVVMEAGRVMAAGQPASLLTDPDVARLIHPPDPYGMT